MATPVQDPATVSAHAILNQFLEQFGLGSLAAWAWGEYTNAGGGDLGMQTVQAQIVTRPEFKTRFPAYDTLVKQGRAMSPAQMLDYENQARAIFHSAGLPTGFYDTPDDFAKFMTNDVSPTELQNRVQIAQTAALTAPEEVRTQHKSLYGIDHGQLTSYFIDPAKALPILQQQYTAAQIAAEGVTTGFGQLNQGQAEHLAQIGVTDQQAQQGFGDLGKQAGLFQQQVRGEDVIDPNVQLAAEFDQNQGARLRIQQRQQARTADFQGRSGFNVGQQGVTGLGSNQ